LFNTDVGATIAIEVAKPIVTRAIARKPWSKRAECERGRRKDKALRLELWDKRVGEIHRVMRTHIADAIV
jgi:hypothetical protein